MSWNVIMHINYCEQGQTFPDLCRKAADWGFDGIEFRSKNYTVDQTDEKYLDVIAHSVSRARLKEVLFGYPAPDMMLSDAAARDDEIEKGIRFYRLAKERFGRKLRICNAMTGQLANPDKRFAECWEKQGSFIAKPRHWKQAVAGFKVIGDEMKKIDLRLAFETHMVYLHDVPASSKKLVDLISKPAIGLNLDYGNIVYFQSYPTLKDTIALFGKSLFYVHLKNSMALPQGGRIDTNLGEGDINHREYLRLLKESGFNGPVCIEAPRQGDREWFAKTDLAYIRSVLDDLGA